MERNEAWLARNAPLPDGRERADNKSKQEHNSRNGGTHERIDKESHR
jgi:hypothetical protein